MVASWWRWAALTLAATTVVFHIGLVFSGLTPNLVSRPIHMALALPWVLCVGHSSRWQRVSGIVLCVLGVAACVWVATHEDALADQYGFLEGTSQLILAIVLLTVVLEAARRSIGWPLPIVALLAIVYGLAGQYIPGEFGHAGTPISSFMGTLTIAEGGLWGSLTGISVGIVAIFVILGATLNAGEAGRGFMNVASAAAGRLKGGAAKVSILASALFGSISGSASANVASTGAITMPAMQKLGYPKRLSAAVEAVASSGGQIMPPLMGAGAFVMVELTGTPYTGVMSAALFPAVLYFIAVWIGVNAYADRFSLKPVAREDQPALREVAITSVFFLIPFSILMWLLLAVGYTPQRSAVVAIFAALILLLFNNKLNFSWGDARCRIETSLISASKQIAMIASIILCASIIVGVLGITGLGIKVTSLILSFSGGLIWPALFLTALACLFLGMEVPTTAAYVICVSVAGPALIDLGMAPLTVHLFVFWYALLSTITPPVCGGVFIAAGMVGENWLRVAITAMSLGIGLYLIPLGMVVHPELLTITQTPLISLIAFGKIAISLSLISHAVISTGMPILRLACFTLGLALLLITL